MGFQLDNAAYQRDLLDRLDFIYRDFTIRHLYLEPWRAVYLPIPKVACTFLKTYFATILGLEVDRIHQRVLPRVPPESIGQKDMFVFTFVRDPIDRAISCFNDKLRSRPITNRHYLHGIHRRLLGLNRQFGTKFSTTMSFEEFLWSVEQVPVEFHDEHFRPQYTFLSSSSGKFLVDKLYPFENLEHSLSKLCHELGVPKIDLKPRNVTKQARVNRDMLTETEVGMIRKIYAGDYKLGVH